MFGATLLALSRTTRLLPAEGLFVLIGLSAICQLATANTLTQSLAPDELRGRAVSAHMFAMAGLQPFGALLAGMVAQRWGVGSALAFGAIMFLAYTFCTLVGRPQVSRLE